ncbi:MAG: alpha/beta hydrolase [Alphaproteobacteria bacterium]|nr:alpha/beta hydrolase [Alphaproteobacteria bacterium]
MRYRELSFFSPHGNGQHNIVYSDWGPEDGTPLICVHGLTGNGHDFDYLAEDLIEHGYRLIAVDLPGRGRSDFLESPLDYNYNQYLIDLQALLTHLGLGAPQSVDWLGVSLGGLLGIRLAGMAHSPIRRLIINDVGPEVPKTALDFIYMVIAQEYAFDTVQDFEDRMRATRGLTWGPVTDEQWHHMAEHNARALEDGRITYAYDPAIAEIFKTEPTGEINLWACWNAIACPVLVIQGADSLLLTDEILQKMEKSEPDFELAIFEGCGHVPSLMAPNQIEVIRQWLKDTPI